MTNPTPIATKLATSMLDVAVEQAELGLSEGGVPVGAALFRRDGTLLGAGRNRRVQHDDPSVHGETDAFRSAGRQRSYADTVMVTTLAPCWYCTGLIRQFGIGAVVVGDSTSFEGGVASLRELGVEVVELHDERCPPLLATFIAQRPDVWFEDIGVSTEPGNEAP